MRQSIRATYYFLYALLILIGIALLFEVYFRLSDQYGRKGITWIPDTGVTGIEYIPVEIWRWRKNMSDRINGADGERFVVHTDQFGFRNYGKSLQKPDGVIRIIVLGDSYTEALNIADDKIFTALLEKNLSGIKPGGKSIEVIGASAPGWSTEQELLCLQNEALEFEPDYVLLMACPNDIREAWCKKFAVLDSTGRVQFNPVKMSRTEIFFWWLSNRLRLFQFLQQKVLHTVYGTFEQLKRHYSFNFSKEDSTNWDRPLFLNTPFPEVDSAKILFNALVGTMQSFCAQRKIDFAVSLTPTRTEFDGTLGADSLTQSGLVSENLQIFCNSNGIDYINLYQRFKENADPVSLFQHPDFHFNNRGHQLTAQVLAEYYRSRIK